MLKGAIIGIGKIAQTGHLPAFADNRIGSSVQITAAADTNAVSLQIASARFPSLRLYSDVRAMLENEHLDFVDICTTPDSHADMIELALSSNLHILCEKPFTSSIDDAERIALKLREHSSGKLAFMPCHQYKFSPLWRQFRSYFRHLDRDTKVFAQFHVYRNSADPGIFGNRHVWRMNPRVGGGGILADTGVHYLYLIPWIFQQPAKITARLHRLANHKEDVEDTVNVIFEFERGVAELVLTWGSARRANHASIICPEGSLEYDGSSLVQYDTESSHTYTVPDASDKSHYTQLYVDLFSHFIDRINLKSVSLMDINEAYESVALLNACYASASGSNTIDYGLNQ